MSNNRCFKYILAVFIGAALSLFLLQERSPAKEPQISRESPAIPEQRNAIRRSIAVAAAVNRRAQGDFILDVRQEPEWEEYHIPGSTLIPLDQLPERINEIPRDREVVIVCRSGSRSAKALEILEGEGFTNTINMEGGLLQWRAEGHPIVSGK